MKNINKLPLMFKSYLLKGLRCIATRRREGRKIVAKFEVDRKAQVIIANLAVLSTDET